MIGYYILPYDNTNFQNNNPAAHVLLKTNLVIQRKKKQAWFCDFHHLQYSSINAALAIEVSSEFILRDTKRILMVSVIFIFENENLKKIG